MQKDGTRYLCLVEYTSGKKDWEVLYWGIPCGFSSHSNKPAWINSAGFLPKIKKIEQFKACETCF